MPLTAQQFADLDTVNRAVNTIPYSAIPGEHEPADWWADAPVAGNSWVCRDYVLAKSERLRQMGWPAAMMTVVLCWTESGEYHAVLAISDGQAMTLILDSRVSDIYRMDEPPRAYLWHRRQIAGTTEFEAVA